MSCGSIEIRTIEEKKSAVNLWIYRLHNKLCDKSGMLELDSVRFVLFLRWIESIFLDLGEEMHKLWVSTCSNGNFGLRLMWHVMHLILSIWYLLLSLVKTLDCFLISSGLLKRYKDLDVSKVQYLAVVIDSEEALETVKVLELLRWLTAIGLENICLYDSEGVLKKSKEALTLWLKSGKMPNDTTTSEPPLEQKYISMEVISSSDGKQAIAKAANFLLTKHYLDPNSDKPNLTESDMTDALEAIGHGGTDPDLMLIYGPTRCHLGFPAWRMRYTEIVHMGPLKSMKFGALLKAIHRFTMVQQNYGK